MESTMHSDRIPTPEFLTFVRFLGQLLEVGVPHAAVEAMLRSKIRHDLAEEQARRREPSLN